MIKYEYSNHLADLKSFARFLKFFLPMCILISFISSTLFAFLSFNQCSYLTELFYYVDKIDSQILLSSISYLNLVYFSRWQLDTISISLILIWGIIGYLIYIFFKIIIGFMYQLIYPVDTSVLRKTGKYYKYFKRSIGKYLFSIVCLLLLVSLTIFIRFNIWELQLAQVIKIIGIILTIFSIIIFTTTWSYFLKLRTKRNSQSKRYFDIYILSQQSIRLRFKTLIIALAFLGFLGTVYLPGYFILINTLTTTYEASIISEFDNWHFLEIANIAISGSLVAPLPTLDSLSSELNTLYPLSRVENYATNIPLLQKYFFLILTIGGLFEIGIPVLAKTVYLSGYKQALKRILVITCKSFFLITLLSFLIKKTYFLDISEPLGIGIIFSFLMTFFFTQDSDNSS